MAGGSAPPGAGATAMGSVDGVTAVDGNPLAGQERGRVGGEKRHRAGDVLAEVITVDQVLNRIPVAVAA